MSTAESFRGGVEIGSLSDPLSDRAFFNVLLFDALNFACEVTHASRQGADISDGVTNIVRDRDDLFGHFCRVVGPSVVYDCLSEATHKQVTSVANLLGVDPVEFQAGWVASRQAGQQGSSVVN